MKQSRYIHKTWLEFKHNAFNKCGNIIQKTYKSNLQVGHFISEDNNISYVDKNCVVRFVRDTKGLKQPTS